MYYRKQLFFVLFILLILLFIFYKYYSIKGLAKDCVIDNVRIVNTYCTNRLTQNNYSYFEFQYKDKLYKQSVNKEKCKEISGINEIELYYYPKEDEFYLPEIIESDYYIKFIIGVTILLVLGLIPYKLFLK